ncbi:hypothetical protein [Halopelagius fulvigenes]|uniref:Uncharacterized protein n=1 Tax=Halopelagius fulvigenes TaxID=1198324 RepID=A0ABD5U3S6_9EURY
MSEPTDAVHQRTLDGDCLSKARIECEAYEGCTKPANVAVGNLGGNAYLDSIDELFVCETCADEYRVDATTPTIRSLTPSERWEAADG